MSEVWREIGSNLDNGLITLLLGIIAWFVREQVKEIKDLRLTIISMQQDQDKTAQSTAVLSVRADNTDLRIGQHDAILDRHNERIAVVETKFEILGLTEEEKQLAAKLAEQHKIITK